MAFTQLYLTAVAAPYTPATLRGAWDDTAGAVTKALEPDKHAGGLATSVARAETSASAAYDVLLYRGVSGKLAAQTIAGTLNLVLGVQESVADADDYWHLHVYVTQGDSDTPRGTLLADYVETTTNEWPTTAAGRALQSAQTLTSLAISDGDRLVVEIGYLASNVLSASRTGTLRYGTCDATLGTPLPDLTVASTAANAGYLVFSASIAEAALPVRVSQLPVEVVGADPAPPARLSQFVVEVAADAGISPQRISQLAVEVVGQQVPAVARISQHVIELVSPNLEVELGTEPQVFLTWVEFTDRVGTVHVWSDQALPDPPAYYRGWKEPRVLTWGTIARALSDEQGQYVGTEFRWTVADTDRVIRGLLADRATKYVANRPLVVRMIGDADRRQQHVPRTVYRGIVRDYRPSSPLQFDFIARDYFDELFSTRRTTQQIPKRVVQIEDFVEAAKAITVQDDVALPFDATLPQVDVAGGGMNQIIWAGAPGFQTGEQVIVTLTGIKDGKESRINEGAIANNCDGAGSACVVSFNGNGTAFDSYRAYFFGPNPGAGDAPTWYDPHGTQTAERVRMKTHDNSTLDGYYGLNFGIALLSWDDGVAVRSREVLHIGAPIQVNAAGLPVPIIYGVITDTPHVARRRRLPHPRPQSGVPVPEDGQCGYLLVGQATLSDGDHYTFLIAAHACQSIDEIYVNSDPQFIASDPLQAGVGGIWKVPGYAGWTAEFGPAKYRDLNGHRYTLVYGKIGQVGPDTGVGIVPPRDQATVPLAFAVHGIEDHADGTGTLITDAALQYRHCLQNWILGDYQTGPWLATPMCADDPSVPQIDDASFDAVSAIAQRRVAGGYRGDFILGGSVVGVGGTKTNGSFITARELIARFNNSFDIQCGFSRKSQFFVTMEDVDALAHAVALSEDDTVLDSVQITDVIANLWNVVPYRHTQDYMGLMAGPASGSLTQGKEETNWRSLQYVDRITDDVSVAKYSTDPANPTPLTAPMLLMYLVRGKNSDTETDVYVQGRATADDVARRRLARHRDPPRTVALTVGAQGFDFELGDILRLSHFTGISVSGWRNRPLRIISHEASPTDLTVALVCQDMQWLVSGGAILGDRTTMPGLWPAATEDQKDGFYLCAPSGLMSDGAEGKRLT